MLVSKAQQSFNIKENSLNNNQTSFKALYFTSPKVKEKVLKTPYFEKLFKNPFIEEAAQKYNLVIDKSFWNSGFLYRICTDVKLEEDKVVPKGLMSPNFNCNGEYRFNHGMGNDDILFRANGAWVGVRHYLSLLASHQESFNKLIFKNEKVKKKFLNNKLTLLFLTEPKISELIEKYNVFIESGKIGISFFASTDVVQNGDKIEPSGYRTSKKNFNVENFDTYSKDTTKDFLDKMVSLSANDVRGQEE